MRKKLFELFERCKLQASLFSAIEIDRTDRSAATSPGCGKRVASIAASDHAVPDVALTNTLRGAGLKRHGEPPFEDVEIADLAAARRTQDLFNRLALLHLREITANENSARL